MRLHRAIYMLNKKKKKKLKKMNKLKKKLYLCDSGYKIRIPRPRIRRRKNWNKPKIIH